MTIRKCENVKMKMFILSDHNGSYRFHSPNVSENIKEQGVKLWLYFKEIAAQAYLLQFKGYLIFYFYTNIEKIILDCINSSYVFDKPLNVSALTSKLNSEILTSHLSGWY